MNFKITVLSVLFIFSFCLNVNAQKPRKIFNYLQENQLTLAVEEYNKISSDKEYDNDDKVLFAYAKCLFQIDTNYQNYNPTQAIKEFNGTIISSEYRQSIYKFLGKYTLSPEVINQKIINELYKEAIKLNTVESYTNALNYYSQEHNDNVVKLLEIASYNRVKSNKVISQLKLFITKYPESIYKTEIQNLLERETLNNYQSINNIDSLNQFITQFNSSVYKPEAIDFRDSLVLSTVPENYDSLLAFTKKYPESKFKKDVESRLPDALYFEIVKSDFNINNINNFISLYPSDRRVGQLDSIKLEKIKFSYKNEFDLLKLLEFYNSYKKLFNIHFLNSYYINNYPESQKKINYKLISKYILVKSNSDNRFVGIDYNQVNIIDSFMIKLLNFHNKLSSNNNSIIDKNEMLNIYDEFEDFFMERGSYFTIYQKENIFKIGSSFGTTSSYREIIEIIIENEIIKELKLKTPNILKRSIESIAGKNAYYFNDGVSLTKILGTEFYEYSILVNGPNDPQCCNKYELIFRCKIIFENDIAIIDIINFIKWREAYSNYWNFIY
jgi:hypothetical protein